MSSIFSSDKVEPKVTKVNTPISTPKKDDSPFKADVQIQPSTKTPIVESKTQEPQVFKKESFIFASNDVVSTDIASSIFGDIATPSPKIEKPKSVPITTKSPESADSVATTTVVPSVQSQDSTPTKTKKPKAKPKEVSSIFDDLDSLSTANKSPPPTQKSNPQPQLVEKVKETPIEPTATVEKSSSSDFDTNIFADLSSKKKQEEEKAKAPPPSIFSDPLEKQTKKKKPAPSLFD